MNKKSLIIGLPLLMTTIVNDGIFQCGAYFPPEESIGGWRKDTSEQFIRSLGIIPDKQDAWTMHFGMM